MLLFDLCRCRILCAQICPHCLRHYMSALLSLASSRNTRRALSTPHLCTLAPCPPTPLTLCSHRQATRATTTPATPQRHRTASHRFQTQAVRCTRRLVQGPGVTLRCQDSLFPSQTQRLLDNTGTLACICRHNHRSARPLQCQWMLPHDAPVQSPHNTLGRHLSTTSRHNLL